MSAVPDAMAGDSEARLAPLMRAAQDGDAAAYRALLRDCVPLIAAAARRTGLRPDRIDDVVQETLITIHRARATYDPQRPFLPWLRAIAQRRAIDHLRHRGRQDRRSRRSWKRSLRRFGRRGDDGGHGFWKQRLLKTPSFSGNPRRCRSMTKAWLGSKQTGAVRCSPFVPRTELSPPFHVVILIAALVAADWSSRLPDACLPIGLAPTD